MTDVLGIYAPVLAFLVVLIVVVPAVSLLRSHSTSGVALLVGILIVGALLYISGIMAGVLPALRGGVYATGEVTGDGGVATQMRVSVNGQDMEVGLRSRYVYEPGTRLDVMIDPVKRRVLLKLGPATT